MPTLNEKQKVFKDPATGKYAGEVISYKKDPNIFYYREIIPGTKSYRTKKIDGAACLAEAIESAYLTKQTLTDAAPVKQSKRGGNRSASVALQEFIDYEWSRFRAGRIEKSTAENKQWTLQRTLLHHLKAKGVTHLSQIDITTFCDWDLHSNSKKSFALISEMTLVKNFLSWCIKQGYLKDEDYIFPKIQIRDEDTTASPAINGEDWKVVRQQIKQWSARYKDHRGFFWRNLFYHYVCLLKHSGARPEELLKLKWKDVTIKDHGRYSASRFDEVLLMMLGSEPADDEEKIAELRKRFSKELDTGVFTQQDREIIGRVPKLWTYFNLRSKKTGNYRQVPFEEARFISRWWRFTHNYLKQQQNDWGRYKDTVIGPDTYVWGLPSKEMRPHTYSMFDQYWVETRKLWIDKVKGHQFSAEDYTLRSCRKTYIENGLMSKTDVFLLAKTTGHDPKVLMKHYQKFDVSHRVDELARIPYSKLKQEPTELLISNL